MALRLPAFGPPARRAAGGRGRLSPGPLQPPAPAVRRNALARRPTGLARKARCDPKSPRVNAPISGKRRSFNAEPSRQWQLRGAEGDRLSVAKEAPAAKDALPSKAGSIGKPCRGVPGGCKGASEGAQPPSRPPAARRAGGPNAGRRKVSVPAGPKISHPYDKPVKTITFER